ncbi:MAG: hypothetical protein M5R41_10290 [Bacteroidia bacterium]|nr:hypothetical protein [Bacteroidia bacterium]
MLGKFGSTLVAVAAESDTSVWAVGDVELGYEIPGLSSGRMKRRANAFHITPNEIKPYAVELDEYGRTTYSALDGVTVEDGNVTFWGPIASTKLRGDSATLRFHRELNGLYIGTGKIKSGTDGHVYMFGGRGNLLRFIGPKHERFEPIPTGTAKTIKSFAQAGPNEFYIGGWDYDSTGGIFHHLRDGMITPIYRETGRAHPITYATAIWASEERLHAVCPDFIYMQSLVNPAVWDTLHIPPPTPDRIVGLPICANGRADNDVFYAGHYATVLHYNGRNLYFYEEISRRFPNGLVIYDIAVSRNGVFLVETATVPPFSFVAPRRHSSRQHFYHQERRSP